MSRYQSIAIVLVCGVAASVFFYKLGQHSAVAPPASGVVRGVGSDLADIEEPAAATVPTGNIGADGGKSGIAAAGRIAHFEIGNRNVKSLFADGDYIWVGTSGGVVRYATKTDDYTVFNNKTPGILSNGIFHVSKVDGKIMVGTYGGGLSVLDPATGNWRNYNIPDGLADQFVYDVVKASNGDIWIATWSGVSHIRGGNLDDSQAWQTFTVENTQGGLPNPWVYAAAEGKNGDMWFATESGLALYRGGKWQNWQHKDGLGAEYEIVRDAIQFTNDPAKASKHHAQQKAEQGLSGVDVAYNPNYIISLAVDKDGMVWCGTWGGGLARFDGTNWQNYTTKDGLPGNHIFMLHRDDAGSIWIGTSKGLTKLQPDGKPVRTLTTADGLFAENVFSMANSSDGSLWVGSFGGVARLGNGKSL